VKFILCLLSSAFCLLISGCAEVEIPTPKDIVTHPLGQQQNIRGWTKEEVKAKWGEPDQVIVLAPDEWGSSMEEWIYQGRYPDVPIDYKYLSKTKHFYFIDNVLVEFKSEEQVEKPEKEA
jgi:hypothetical protein